MGAARRELKIVAGIATLVVTVAVTAAVFLSMSLSGNVDEQRTAAQGLRGQVATLTDKAEVAKAASDQADRDNNTLRSGFLQCQKAITLTDDFMDAAYEAGVSDTEADWEAAYDKAELAENAAIVCLDQKVDVVSAL